METNTDKKNTQTERLSWDQYFLKIAMLVAERSTCLRHNVGAIVVKKKRIMTTGYNGAAAGVRDCLELGCLRNKLKIPSGTMHEICRAIHAEQNAIIQAARLGINIEDATLYCTHSPCIICAKMIVNAGIKRVVSFTPYSEQTFADLFKEATISYEIMERPEATIRYTL